MSTDSMPERMSGEATSVQTRRDGHVFLVTLNRPQAHNAINPAMSRALCAAWCELRDDPELRVAVLTGAGDRAFCAGADLKEIGAFYQAMSPIERRELGEHQPGLGGITRNLDPGKPIIAAIDGHCLAGGLELALACDLRIATGRSRFGLPEVTRGILPGAGGTQRLPRAMPLGLAMEMLLTGAPMDAQRALAGGLINRIVPVEELADAALELARRIAANAPLAVRAARAAALQGLQLPLTDGLRLEQFYAEPLRTSEDAAEGIAAFVHKRAPTFRGR
jgi:enoyl-CoA hydratase/carnithine racemase